MDKLPITKGWGNWLSHLLFPRLCEGCRRPLIQAEEVICLGCETHLPRTNYHHIADNESALRLSGRIPFRYATSLAYFTKDSLAQHLVHRLKYHDRKQVGIFLGRELGKAIKKEDWGIDAVVPVPLHKKKEAARGYNQSEYIGKGISDILQVPLITHALIRYRNTESQTDKTRDERLSNVSKAFGVVRSDLIHGKHLLLTDDVLTTGATLESCAEALRPFPDISVSIATAGLAQ